MATITKLNPIRLLSQLAEANSSGCLTLDEGLVSWKIYLQEGKLGYVECSAQLMDQLKYYLRYFKWKQTVAALQNLPSSCIKLQSYLQDKYPQQHLYSQVIIWLLKDKHLDQTQGSKLIEYMTRDALQTCLWLNSGTSTWQPLEPVPAWIIRYLGNPQYIEFSKYLNSEINKLKQWQRCSLQLLSAHQRPYFTSGWEQKSLPTSGSLNRQNLQELSQVIKGGISIRQLSLMLKKNEVNVAQILSPYIDSKIIYLRQAQAPLDRLPSVPRRLENFQQKSFFVSDPDEQDTEASVPDLNAKTWKIVCIDDSPTILKEIKRFLNSDKFNITAIDNPVQAVSQIFQINPDLILLDITMPRINGYKLCGLLRSSGKCDDTPIIMVTGNTGLIDKARAKISGATDYFTKPFTKQGLMEVVEKYLH